MLMERSSRLGIKGCEAARVRRREVPWLCRPSALTATEPAKKSPGDARQPSGAAIDVTSAATPPTASGLEARLIASSARDPVQNTQGRLQVVVLDSPSGRRHFCRGRAARWQRPRRCLEEPSPPARGRLPPVGRGARADSDREGRLAGHLGLDLAPGAGSNACGAEPQRCPCSGDRCCGSNSSGAAGGAGVTGQRRPRGGAGGAGGLSSPDAASGVGRSAEAVSPHLDPPPYASGCM